jgi:hypothetical protein
MDTNHVEQMIKLMNTFNCNLVMHYLFNCTWLIYCKRIKLSFAHTLLQHQMQNLASTERCQSFDSNSASCSSDTLTSMQAPNDEASLAAN